MYTYGEVEAALARVNRIPAEATGAFRGRLKNLQRIGVAAATPGKGKKIEYTLENAYRWAFCLELAQSNIDPTIIAKIARLEWWKIWPRVPDDAGQEQDWYFFLHPSFLGHDFPADTLQSADRPHGAPYAYSAMVEHDLKIALDKLARTDEARDFTERFLGRYSVLNLSQLYRDVARELGCETMSRSMSRGTIVTEQTCPETPAIAGIVLQADAT